MSDVPRSLTDQEGRLKYVFERIRTQVKTHPGLAELLDVLRIVPGVSSDDELKQIARALWCYTDDDRQLFDQKWDEYSSSISLPPSVNEPSEEIAPPLSDPNPVTEPPKTPEPSEEEQHDSSPSDDTPDVEDDGGHFSTESEAEIIEPKELADVFRIQQISSEDASMVISKPFSKKQVLNLLYRKKRLREARHLVVERPEYLNIRGTIDRFIQDGAKLFTPIYDPPRVQCNVMLLVDVGGSMVPSYPLVRLFRDAVKQVYPGLLTFYFHNILASYSCYTDMHRSQPMDYERVQAHITPQMHVIIISDAGAARGGKEMMRVLDTREFLMDIRKRTNRVMWLNPIPHDRWRGCTAEYVSRLVPMQPLIEHGIMRASEFMSGAKDPIGLRLDSNQ